VRLKLLNLFRLGRDEGDRIFKEVTSQYDAPAFMRRARRVQGSGPA
jgi:hypothetical protein